MLGKTFYTFIHLSSLHLLLPCPFRSVDQSGAETETNPIDRSIAHLLFHCPSGPRTRTVEDATSLESHITVSFIQTSPTYAPFGMWDWIWYRMRREGDIGEREFSYSEAFRGRKSVRMPRVANSVSLIEHHHLILPYSIRFYQPNGSIMLDFFKIFSTLHFNRMNRAKFLPTTKMLCPIQYFLGNNSVIVAMHKCSPQKIKKRKRKEDGK